MNDGGPAFPIGAPGDFSEDQRGSSGMSLRDYFAAAAIQALLSGDDKVPVDVKQNIDVDHYYLYFARLAYRFADAMIERRLK